MISKRKSRENILGRPRLELPLFPFSKCYVTFKGGFLPPYTMQTGEQQHDVDVTLHRI